jgi:hypothetical protein
VLEPERLGVERLKKIGLALPDQGLDLGAYRSVRNKWRAEQGMISQLAEGA